MTHWQLDISAHGQPTLTATPSRRDRVSMSGRAYAALVGRRHPRVSRIRAMYRARHR